MTDAIIEQMRTRAERGVFTGDINDDASNLYLVSCRHYCPHTKAMLIFTRDRCDKAGTRVWHLSVSFCELTPDTIQPLPFNPAAANAWAKRLFGDFVDDIWIEGPKSEQGQERQVWHYRLFVDQGWHMLAHEVPDYVSQEFLRWHDLQQPANA